MASSLAIDRLSPEELRALDAWEQASALNDLAAEIKRIGDKMQECHDRIYTARRSRLDGDDTLKARTDELEAKRDLDKLKIALGVRKEQTKIFQTLLRAIPA